MSEIELSAFDFEAEKLRLRPLQEGDETLLWPLSRSGHHALHRSAAFRRTVRAALSKYCHTAA